MICEMKRSELDFLLVGGWDVHDDDFFLCVRFFRRRRCRLCLVLVGCVVHDEGLRIPT